MSSSAATATYWFSPLENGEWRLTERRSPFLNLPIVALRRG